MHLKTYAQPNATPPSQLVEEDFFMRVDCASERRGCGFNSSIVAKVDGPRTAFQCIPACTALTFSPAMLKYAVISPDGHYLAYCDGDIGQQSVWASEAVGNSKRGQEFSAQCHTC